jgi:hypothetical protein
MERGPFFRGFPTGFCWSPGAAFRLKSPRNLRSIRKILGLFWVLIFSERERHNDKTRKERIIEEGK